jgi:hypothetical protein
MGQHIDQLREELRAKFARIDDGLHHLKAKVNDKAEDVEYDVRHHLKKVEQRIEQGRANIAAAQSEVKNWADERKSVTHDKIAEWKAKRETNKLHSRADRAERYAVTAIELAGTSIDEAERAALEAWLARQEATSAQVKQATRP